MFHLRKNRRRRSDAPAPRVRRPRSRRLAFEPMENRLLLSGNQATSGELDYTIWNLDSLQDKYEIISQGESLPGPSMSTSSTAGPSGAELDVSWVKVPDMLLSASDAQKLAYSQYREAMSQGVINFQQSSALYQEWLSGFSFDTSSALVPVYTIGIRNLNVTPEIGGLTDLFTDSSSFVTDAHLSNTIPLVDSVGSTGSPFLPSTPIFILSNNTPSGLDEDVRNTGDFNRDGVVNAADYMAWRDAGGSSDMLAYNNWKAHFGQSMTDVLTSTPLDTNLAADHFGVLEPRSTITVDVTHMPDVATPGGPLTAGVDITIASQDDVFPSGTPPIIQLNPQEASDSLPRTTDSIAYQDLNITINPATIATTEDANVATSGPMLIIDVDGGSTQLIVSSTPAKVDTPAARQSKAEEELGQAIDELLAGDTIIVAQSGDTNSSVAAEAKPADAPHATELTSAESDSASPADPATPADGSTRLAAADQLAEGGMISIDEIVDAATGDAAAQNVEQLAADGESTELVGELSRVAVMELIEGEAEPDASQTPDHAVLIAADGAATSLEEVQAATEQASLAIGLVSPVSPAYFSAIANAASHAFAAVVGPDFSGSYLGARRISAAAESNPPADAARSEAFSQFAGDDPDKPAAADETSPSHLWLDAAPVVLALACERALAIKMKRRERDSCRRSIKAK